MGSRDDDAPVGGGFPADPDWRYVAAFIGILAEERMKQGLGERDLSRRSGIGNGVIGRAERLERIPGVVVFRRWVRGLGLDWVETCRKADRESR